MPLVDVSFVREDHNLSDRQPDSGFIEKRLKEAAIELKKWIGTEEYNAAYAALYDDESEPSPELLEKAEIYQLAESALVMYFAIPRLNLKVSEQGLMQSATSKNFGDATFRVATPGEIKALRKLYWNDAWKLVYTYVPKGIGPLPAGSTNDE